MSIINATNGLTAAFILWSIYILSSLSRVISPPLPLLHDGSGRLLPLSYPLWSASPGLTLSLRLSDRSQREGSASTPSHSVDLLGSSPFPGLQYGWEFFPGLSAASLDTELILEVLREGGGSSGKVSGLRLTCQQDVLGEYSPVCLALARRRAAAVNASSSSSSSQAAQRNLAQEAALVLKKGILTSALSGLARALGGGGEGGAAPASAAPSTEVLHDTSPAAAALGRALLRGRPVWLQSTLAWAAAAAPTGASSSPSAPPSPPSALKALLSAFSSSDSQRAEAEAAAALQRTLAGIAPSAVPAELRSLSTEISLVHSVPYIAPIHRRYLWRGAVGNSSALPSLLGVDLQVERRAQEELLSLSNSTSTSSKQPWPPQAGQPWPHFLGQVDLRLILDTAPFPRDDMPRHVSPYLRAVQLQPPAAPQPTAVYLPRLAVNPVRPTRDRLLPLNATSCRLALRLTLAPMAAGAWNLMTMMDASITQQHSLGATARDTDDVIRLLNDTPSWLLVVIFAATFLHLLFEVLATKADVSFWAGARSLRGISVRTLGVSALSQAVVTAYLAREGSSLLVTVPAAGGVALALWKMGVAGGCRWRVRWGCLPCPSFDAALAASGGAGLAGLYDREAVGAMTALLLPLLCGAALRSLVHDMHAGWQDWALGSAVAAVYSAGFALMTPQLWLNYRLQSVAHLPWNVLGFRFFNTVIDDVFAAFIKMPL